MRLIRFYNPWTYRTSVGSLMSSGDKEEDQMHEMV